MVSTAPVGVLMTRLPIAALQEACYSFRVTTYKGRDPRLRSRIVAVGAGTTRPWALLARHESALQRYRVTQVELAFDVKCASINDARAGLFALIARLDKGWHRRGHLRLVQEPTKLPPPGHLPDLPTIYYEDRRSRVAMKCYARHEKVSGGSFGGLVVRLEWTLTGTTALARHVGGNQVNHLLGADLNAFLERKLRLADIDHLALGKLFNIRNDQADGTTGAIKNRWSDPDCRALRAARVALHAHAYREYEQGRFETLEDAVEICERSPAQIRGYLRKLRQRNWPGLTDYRINGCFRPVLLQAV
jgi:hypothetical protein